jgi:hypothetical protein
MPNISAGNKLNVQLMLFVEPTEFPLSGKKNREEVRPQSGSLFSIVDIVDCRFAI